LLVGLIPLAFGLVPGTEADRLERLLIGYGLAGLPFLWVLARWRSVPSLHRLLLAALGARLPLLLLPPLLSEDAWRYVWDGAVQLAGHDPYAYAPLHPALDALAHDPTLAWVRTQIGHGHIPTIYFPTGQIFFAFVGLAGPDPIWIRLLLVAADALAIAALWHWARRLGHAPQVAALYAFAPPAVLEGAVGGHLDHLGVALLVVAGAALAGGQRWRAGVALGISIGTKLLPVVVLPLLLVRARPVVAGALLACGLLALPYLGGPGPFEGLAAFSAHWRGNDGFFALLIAGFEQIWPQGQGPVELPEWAQPWVLSLVGAPEGAHPWGDAVVFAAAKLTAAGVLGLVWLSRVVRLRRAEPAAAFAGLLGPTIAAVLLLSPILHPWYLLWVLPFLALGVAAQRAWVWPLVVWNLTIFLAYWPRPDFLRTGVWQASPTLAWVEYLPVWGGLAFLVARGVQRRLFRQNG
jgi:hypothetical protein